MMQAFQSPSKQLLVAILSYCETHGVSETRFGTIAVGDPNLVRNMKGGRELRSPTIQKVIDVLNTTPKQAAE